MLNPEKSVLLNSSAGTDVQNVGGEIIIPGLEKIRQSRVVDISQINYRAEVSQVVTVGATAYDPTASTTYTVLIGDTARRTDGQGEYLVPYSYTTPPVITTLGATAALQREAIHLALVAKINALSTNWVVAATLGTGTGFTITDDAGYYPYNRQGMTNREGASTIKLRTEADGTGFAITNIALTTAAVYSIGVGANLANSAPVYDLVTGNLIQGEIYAPLTVAKAPAVSGQKYNMFSISFLRDVNLPLMASSYKGLSLTNVSIWVDNGAGASVTNLAGYVAFERAMHRLIAERFAADATTSIEFFDNNFVIQGPLGAAPATTTSLKNKFLTTYGLMNHYNIGTQTIVAPTQGANGLLVEQDATATEGAHYSAEVAAICPKEFVVGKTAVTLIHKFSLAEVENAVYMAGLRTKSAFTLDFNDYTNLAAVGTGASGTDLTTYGILANAATVATDTTLNAVDAVAVNLVVKVDISGLVSIYVNDTKVPVYSAGTTPLTFAAGTILIPFFQYTNLNSAAAVINVTEHLALPSDRVLFY
jgi:hypothetical protein